MKLFRVCRFSIVCFMLFYSTTAQTGSNPAEKGMRVDNLTSEQSKGNTYALIVGISAYKKLPRLNYADSDALAFRDFLTTRAGGHVPLSNIRVYLNDNDSVTGTTIYNLGIKNWLAKKELKKGDRIYIYLSGHGDSELGTSYFLTSQCNPASGYQSNDALQISTIKDFIRYITPVGVQVIFIFDACRTNEKRTAGGQTELNNFIRTEQVGGEILMIAADAGETSIEDHDFGGGHGLFTYYLLLGLAGYADSYPDGKITFNELENYVKSNVYNEAQKRKHDQTPYFNTVDKNPVIAYVDSGYFKRLVKADSLHRLMFGGEEVYAKQGLASRSGEGSAVSDSNALSLYNSFTNALRGQNLLGENSADSFYRLLEKRYPSYPLTDDARYRLANEFINYSQRKINIHLNGKDISYVNNVRKTLISDSTGQNPLTREVTELERVMKVKFGDAARMMERAIDLLKDDTAYVKTLQTKLWFLQAKSYYDELNSAISYDSALHLMRRAIAASPNASYCYNLLGQLYHINRNKTTQDSSEFMYKRAVALSPAWVYPYRNLAAYYRQNKSFANSVDNYKKAIALDPTDGETFNEMGILYYTQKDYAQAEQYYSKSLAVDSLQKYASRNLGLLYSVQNKRALSEKYYLLSIKIDSNYADSYYSLGDQYALIGQNEAAEKYYKKAIEKNPNNPDYFNDLGLFYYNKGHDSLAIIYYKWAIGVNPSYVLSNNNLGLLYKNENKPELAKKYYSRAIALDSINASAYNGMGLVYYSAKNYDSAEYYFRKAIRSDSTLKFPYYNLGNVNNARTKYTIAESFYQKAIRVDSNYSYAYYMLGGLYKKMNQYPAAGHNYLKAIRLDSTNAYFLNDLAVLFNDAGKPEEAEEFYKKAIQVNPSYVLAYTNLGLLYKGAGKIDDAEKYFKLALGLDSANASAFNGLGQLNYTRGNKDSLAELQFKKAIAADSSYVYPWCNLANLYNRQKKYPFAEQYYRKAMQIDSNYSYAFSQLAAQYMLLHDTVNAEKHYLQVLRRDRANGDMLDNAGLFFIRLGKDSIAEICYQKSTLLDAAYSLGYYRLAGIYKRKHQPIVSENYYLKSLRLDSTDMYAWNDLGVLYDDEHKTNLAENCYRKALRINPKYLLTYNNLALLYKNSGQYALAEKCYQQIISIDSTDPSPYNMLGLVYYLQKNNDAAAEVNYKKSAKLDSMHTYSFYNLAILYNRQKKFELAEKYYLHIIRMDSTNAGFYNGLGLVYYAQREPGDERAEAAFKKAIQLDPKLPYSYTNLANLYIRQKKNQDAIQICLMAIDADSLDATLYNQLGFSYGIDGKNELAREAYLNALAIDPNYPDACANLGDNYKSLHDFTHALEWYKKSVKIDSNYRYGFEQMGLLYLGDLNDPKKGRETFEVLVAKFPSDSNCNYNLACAYSRLGNVSRSLHYLEAAIKYGITDTGLIRKDTDLVLLRKDPRFEKLMKKYFPGK